MKSEVNAKQSKFKKIFLICAAPTIDYFVVFAYIPMAGLVIGLKITLPLLGYWKSLGWSQVF
ncbi:MAG: hypothetical protein ACLT8H_09645 [Streptococcus parasanguinis]